MNHTTLCLYEKGVEIINSVNKHRLFVDIINQSKNH